MMFQWVATDEHDGMTIKEFLLEVQGMSRKLLTALKYDIGGAILLNGAPVTVRAILTVNDHIAIRLPEESPSAMTPYEYPLAIVYEDEHLLVIDKVADMPTIPSREHPQHSVANALVHYYHVNGIPHAIHIVNRLDRGTSGLLVVAKHRYAHHLFSVMQRKKEMKRSYTAIVHGNLQEEAGTIEAPIGRKQDSIIEREVRTDGQYALTRFKVIERKNNVTKVSLTLETGRTHQIRVHMAYLGHPLVGDDLYGGGTEKIDRQALHCHELSFIHPFHKRLLEFCAPLPQDMANIWNEFE